MKRPKKTKKIEVSKKQGNNTFYIIKSGASYIMYDSMFDVCLQGKSQLGFGSVKIITALIAEIKTIIPSSNFIWLKVDNSKGLKKYDDEMNGKVKLKVATTTKDFKVDDKKSKSYYRINLTKSKAVIFNSDFGTPLMMSGVKGYGTYSNINKIISGLPPSSAIFTMDLNTSGDLKWKSTVSPTNKVVDPKEAKKKQDGDKTRADKEKSEFGKNQAE